MDSGGGVRLESHNLRDLLRLKEEEQHSNFNQSTSSNGGGGRRSASGLTLLAILTENRGPPPRPPADEPLRGVQSSRTLLDIIREDEISCGRRDGGRRWRNLTDKILLRHGGSGWSSAVEDNSRRSTQFNSNAHPGESSQSVLNARVPISHNNSSAQTERFDVQTRRSVTEDTDNATGGAGEQPARASLMELLAENDFQLGFGDSSYAMLEEEEILIGDNAGTGAGGVEYNCCVCMVRHKGAAFIPCGHTFCRVCSRELWSQRGNCPLCNNYISEILDIF